MQSGDLLSYVDVSRETLDRLEIYARLLVKYQRAKNLVSVSTLDDLWRRHFLDSLQLLPLVAGADGRTGPILDIGSGAGFPGLVLAIAGAEPVHMVEANARKCAFMRQVIRETGANAVVHNARIEALEPFPVKTITSRACAKTAQLLDWAAPFIADDTQAVFLKGEKLTAELTALHQVWTVDARLVSSMSDPSGHIAVLRNLRPASGQ